MWLYPSKMEGITNESVNKEQQAQNWYFSRQTQDC